MCRRATHPHRFIFTLPLYHKIATGKDDLDLFVQPAEPSDNWPRHRLAEGFGGESPQMADLTGDGAAYGMGLSATSGAIERGLDNGTHHVKAITWILNQEVA